MKIIAYLVNAGLLIGFFVFAGCGSDDSGPNLVDLRKELLASAAWNVNTVAVDGIDISSAFVGSRVTFQANGNFTTTIDPTFSDVWPSTGIWSLTSLDIMVVNSIDMTISNASTTSLTLSFPFIGASAHKGGRISSLNGNYVMTFTR